MESSSRYVTEAAPARHAESAVPALHLRGVGRRFGGLHAVREVDLDVMPGERRAILGPNGAGQTPLFHVLSGDFPPTSGRVELFREGITLAPAPSGAGVG